MVVPCPSVQPIEEALEDCTRNMIPILLYAINKDSLAKEQVAELLKVKELFSSPIFFVRIPDTIPEASPEPGRRAEKEKEREKSALHKQLHSVGFISSPPGNCPCGTPTLPPPPGVRPQSLLCEAFERLHRMLLAFARHVLQYNQVEAASLLNRLHCRCLDLFINQVRAGWRAHSYTLLYTAQLYTVIHSAVIQVVVIKSP